MKYKYKVGQKIKYKTTESYEIECPTCGHFEQHIKDIKATGTIKRRWQEPIWNVMNGFASDGIELIKGGTLDYKPPKHYKGELTVIPIYEIEIEKGISEIITEDKIYD